MDGDRTAHLFVYGTLCSDSSAGAARELRAGATRIGSGSIAARRLDLGAYPGAVPSDDPTERVHGEVWLVRPEAAADLLRLLDDYEGCRERPPLFRRALADVRCDDGRTRRALVYYYARSGGGRLGKQH